MHENKATLSIPSETHKQLVAFCKQRGLTIYVWVSKALLKQMEWEKQNEPSGNADV